MNKNIPNDELGSMKPGTIKGNPTSTAAKPSDITLGDIANYAGAGDTTKFLRGDGTWAVPSGGGGISDGDKGDITVSGSGSVWTIDNDVVTYAKQQNVSAASRLLGRGSAAGSGDPQELSLGASLVMNGTTVERAALTGDVAASQNSNSTAIQANVVLDTMLRQSGALAVVGRSANSTGNVADIQATAASGGVLRESGSTIGFGTVATAGLANNSVTDAILRDSGALSVIGRAANSSGDPADISASAGSDAVLRESGSTIGFGQVATAGIADDAVTNAKFRNSGALSVIGRASNSSGDPADISSSADGDALIRVGTTLVFGAYRDVQSFLTAGTFSGGSGWVKPTSFTPKFVESLVGGSGGGGGGGGSNTTVSNHQGGGGGGGGAFARRLMLASDLGSNETVIVGAQGTAGAQSGAGPANGGAGGVGGTSSFGTTIKCQACGGGGGSAGSSASNFQAGGGGGGVGGPGATGTTATNSSTGGAPLTTGEPATVNPGVGGGGGWGGNTTTSLATCTGRPAEFGGGGGGGHTTTGNIAGPGGTSLFGGGGGGVGGSLNGTGPVANSPSAGGNAGTYDAAGGGGGAAGTSGASPTSPASPGANGDSTRGGAGGGGGGSTSANNTAGAAGADGGNGLGGGGGGGGGSGNGTGTGGLGGKGGLGAVYVISY